MARKDHGNKLRLLVLQPGSRFTTSRAGLDTGTRTWLVDAEYAATKEPLIGGEDIQYKGMFLDSLETTFQENGVAQVVGNYLGIKNPNQPKPDVFDEGSDSEYSAMTQLVTGIPYTFHRPRPRVTHTYIRKEKPNIMDVGQNIVPKDFPATFSPGQAYQQQFGPLTIIFSGWILASRNIRRAGLSPNGSIYEIVDVYTYEHSTVPES